MSMHMIGLHAENTLVQVDGEGTEIGEDTVGAGRVALSLGSYSDVAVIEGTPDEVRALLQKALDALVPEPNPVLTRADGEEEGAEVQAGCPHVFTAEEVAEIQLREDTARAAYRAKHGTDWLRRYTVPTAGEQCGADITAYGQVGMYRSVWWDGDTLVLGDSKFADDGGSGEELTCGEGHTWSVPADVEYD